jgi:hypothetical protein
LFLVSLENGCKSTTFSGIDQIFFVFSFIVGEKSRYDVLCINTISYLENLTKTKFAPVFSDPISSNLLPF